MQSIIEHKGVIQSIDGTIAHVLIDQMSACAACHAREACAASDKAEKIIDARIIDGSFAVGDKVMVAGHKSIGIQAVLIAYVLPFLLIIAAMFVANTLTDNELVVGTVGLAILIPYFFVIRAMRGKIQARFQFYVTKA